MYTLKSQHGNYVRRFASGQFLPLVFIDLPFIILTFLGSPPFTAVSLLSASVFAD